MVAFNLSSCFGALMGCLFYFLIGGVTGIFFFSLQAVMTQAEKIESQRAFS